MCLGSLENADSDKVINQILEKVKEENFEFEDFKIAFYVSSILSVWKLYFYAIVENILEQKY